MNTKIGAAERNRSVECWRDFVLHGEWTMEMPTCAGLYPTMTIDGWRGPDRLIYYDGVAGKMESTAPWEAYWWSKPYPKLPVTK